MSAGLLLPLLPPLPVPEGVPVEEEEDLGSCLSLGASDMMFLYLPREGGRGADDQLGKVKLRV